MALKKSQKSLKDWTKQKWRTKSGKPSAKTGERYLPSKAIAALSPAEYAATTRKKKKDTKKGKQFSKQPKSIAKKTKAFRKKGGTVAAKKKKKTTGKGMKGLTIGKGDKRPTKSGAGLTAKGVAKYRRQNPGSKLQTAVTEKKPRTKARAARRKSFCARSAGQMKKFPKAAKNPNSRLRQARRRWKC
tara:strand:- start:154 stop:714 length:561 start_codon:yes stop_codon:yes gene_type:complete